MRALADEFSTPWEPAVEEWVQEERPVKEESAPEESELQDGGEEMLLMDLFIPCVPAVMQEVCMHEQEETVPEEMPEEVQQEELGGVCEQCRRISKCLRVGIREKCVGKLETCAHAPE